jgi:hypothetical protein
MPLRLSALILVVVCAECLVAQPPIPETLVFEDHIQPILALRCGKCHSDDVRKGELNLSSMASLVRGGESGESLVADSLEDSLLWSVIEDEYMPPEAEPGLSAEQLSLVKRWISSGASSRMASQIVKQAPNQHDVQPILLLRCTTCHGARQQQGGLDLRNKTAMLRGGKSGPAFVAGQPDQSLMIQRIESEACPPRDQLLKFFVKRPSIGEVDTLREWIAANAPESPEADEDPERERTKLISAEERAHWAFQPPKLSPGNPSIDAFIIDRLREQGLDLSPEAERDTLIRRAYIDLVGMPPSVEDWQRWHHHPDPEWYRLMIDHLLASPHYGERWGRYWLDLAGYADSEGGVSADPIREVAWKYRDYVIRAFNSDKPYDQFLLEQIAGDELIDYENAAVITQAMVDNLIATGFLRMGIDQTGSRTMNFVPERIGVISDAITVLSEGLMGLTLSCARCHSHKYDPIPHSDYYRFKATLQGALDEHDWLSFKNRNLEIDIPERQQRVAEVNPPLQNSLKKLESRLKDSVNAIYLELLRQHYPEQLEEDNEATLRALKIADNNRTQPQRILVEKLQKVEVLPDSEQPASVLAAYQVVNDIEKEIEHIKGQMEPPLTIRALWDRGQPSPTYVLRRGEHDKPGQHVQPGIPSVLSHLPVGYDVHPPFPDGTQKTGRRLAFARWLTQPNHPLTTRVMVNRIWYHHFGTGLVRTLENFGMKGETASHPELLDWLAIQFVNRGWSVKAMHRLIMNSATYKQSSRITQDHLQLDPQNRLLSRMPLRRLDAESLRDSLLFVAGQLDTTFGGRPDSVSVGRDGLATVNPTPEGRWRRSIYLQYRRTDIPTMLETFDYPEMGPNCLTRSVSTVSLQPLMLMNNRHVRDLADTLASRIEAQCGSPHDASGLVEAVYLVALSRSPSSAEQHLGVQTLKALQTQWRGQAHEALTTYCHTILNSAAFIYID